jgi:hypothetical protein
MSSTLNSTTSEQNLLDLNDIRIDGDNDDDDDVVYDETVIDVSNSTPYSCWGRCAAEAKLNCSDFKTALQEEKLELKEDLAKLPPCPSWRELCTIDRIAKRLPIIKWLPKYR